MSNSSIYLFLFFFLIELIPEGEHVCVFKYYSSLIGWRSLISQIIIYIDNYLTNNHLHTN